MSKWIKEIIVRYDDKQSFIYGNTLGEVVGELVRCKECKWATETRMKSIEGDVIYLKTCPSRTEVIDDDDYCSYGEREGE